MHKQVDITIDLEAKPRAAAFCAALAERISAEHIKLTAGHYVVSIDRAEAQPGKLRRAPVKGRPRKTS